MLRASVIENRIDFDVAAIGNRSIEPRRPDAAALLELTDALVTRSEARLAPARDAVERALGQQAVAVAAATAGNFEMMNRIVDSTGVPVPARIRSIASELGLSSPTGR